MEFDYIGYVVMPILIFLARIVDVSLGTVRIIFVSKNMKGLSALLGFFEVLVWVLAINKIMTDSANYIFYIAYALGFSAGTYIGMMIEQKLSVGKVLVRIITRQDPKNLIEEIKILKSGLTIVDGEGRDGKVKILFSVINRRDIKKIKEIINKNNPLAFYSIEDVRYAKEYLEKTPKKFFGVYRKGK